MTREDEQRLKPENEPLVPLWAIPSDLEIARRRRLFAETMRLCDEIGPIGISVTDLIHEGRAEEEARYEETP
jgi:hypothetical protein